MKHRRRHNFWPVIPLLACLGIWWIVSWANQCRVVPSPHQTWLALLALLGESQAWRDLGLTLLRGTAGLLAGSLLGIAAGILCGRNPRLHDAVSPVVTLTQSCPPIVWITLLLVWISLGNLLPATVAFLSVFPVLFVNSANATRDLDERWFELGKVYQFSPWKRLRKILLPGISHGLAAGFSYAFGITWKVTATAEFFGAQDGIGARIYQCYHDLELPRLFAWTLLIACIGVAIDLTLVRKIRRK